MAEVVWTRGALRDLEAIRHYIGQFSPLASQRMASRLVSAARNLDVSPHRGHALGDGRWELRSIAPYLIRYRVEQELIFVYEI